MKNLGKINEKSSAIIRCDFVDEDGVSITPSSATYRIDTASGFNIIATTDFPTQSGSISTKNITLTRDNNTLLDSNAAKQAMILTVTFVYGGNRYGTAEFGYTIVKLRYLT